MLVFGIFVFQFMQMMQSLPLLSVGTDPVCLCCSVSGPGATGFRFTRSTCEKS